MTAPARLDIQIHRPEKTETRYAIALSVTAPGQPPAPVNIGIKQAEFPIPHHEFWDSFLPLMFLSRNGGPMFNKPIRRAIVRADYPLHAAAIRFFTARARNFGLEMEVDSPGFERVYDDAPTAGDVLLFGGGKDSRLLLGTLREIGRTPRIISARGARYARDLPESLNFEVLNFSMPNRIVPALMLRPRHLWYGSGLPDVHLNTPWQQHYDISGYTSLRATSELLQQVGFNTTLHGPQNVLPQNLTQSILYHRYPTLYAGQDSIDPHRPAEKNLHISLLKRYHGMSTADHCDAALFQRMLQDFMAKALGPGPQFGHHKNREAYQREMRAIILRLHRRGRLDPGDNPAPPDSWDAPWIDFIHPQNNPDTAPDLLAIYREHAGDWPGDAPGLPDCLRPYTTGAALPA